MNTNDGRKSLFHCVYQVLCASDPDTKCNLVDSLNQKWSDQQLILLNDDLPANIAEPGRPEEPILVHPSKLAKRSLHTVKGRLVLMHAIAHIEFNAINLACDAVYRFRGLPEAYYSDWLSVALDEARHFHLIRHYLQSHNIDYGDYPAHNGLWDMAVRTADDVLIRMALVPRVLEARGLDVTPGMINAFREAGDKRAASILETIYQEEINHVAAGSYWFKTICRQRGLEPVTHFQRLISQYMKGDIKGPLNVAARKKAGFEEQEIEFLTS